MIDWKIMHKHMMKAIIKLEVENVGLKQKLDESYDHIIELNQVIDKLKNENKKLNKEVYYLKKKQDQLEFYLENIKRLD